MGRSFWVGLGVLFCVRTYASLNEFPNIMETFGDSITRGFVAKQTLNRKDLTPLEVRLAFFKMAGSMGDRKKLDAMASPDLAWPEQLRTVMKIHGSEIEVLNKSSTNTTSSHLRGQVEEIGKSVAPTMAFFFMGQNDICDRQGVLDEELVLRFRTNYSGALKLWESNHQNSTAYLLPVADISEVYTFLWDKPWGNGKQNCSQTYLNYAPLCLPLARAAQKDADEFKTKVGGRTKKLNQVLAELTQEMNFAVSSNRYVYLQKLEKPDLKQEYFALDCFHLNELGQTALGQMIWELIS